MAYKNFGLTKSMEYLSGDPRVVVWTTLQIPPTKEIDTNHWNGLFQPLVHSVGHKETVWARVRDNPNVALLATCKSLPFSVEFPVKSNNHPQYGGQHLNCASSRPPPLPNCVRKLSARKISSLYLFIKQSIASKTGSRI